MEYSKKIVAVVAMVLCFSLCMGKVSHAETIKYKETKYNSPVSKLKNAETFNLRIDSSGRVVLNLSQYKQDVKDKKAAKKTHYARVTYDSKGKKTVNSTLNSFDIYGDKYVYGNKVYVVVDKGIGEKKKQLVVCNKKGKTIKKININVSNYLKKKSDFGLIKMAEIVGANKVRLYFYHTEDYVKGYGGMLEVNTSTGKIKKLFMTDEFVPMYYDGKYVYNSKISEGKVTFFRKSLKTGKTDKFTADAISYDEEKYRYTNPIYSFYNGKIMVLEPTGRVYYGEFETGTFEQVGDISECANFKKQAMRGFVMKSKTEFYAVYDPSWKKNADSATSRCGKLFMVKYKKQA